MIVVGTGSAMNIAGPLLDQFPHYNIAVIDKDEPGGICLTRGCIPSKMLTYPAELVRTIEHAKSLGVHATIDNIDFKTIMQNMRDSIEEDIDNIRLSLSNSDRIDYYPEVAEFINPYTLKVGDEEIYSKQILLCLGSRPYIPPIKNLEETEYITSKELLQLQELPQSVVIIGGGYIAAEYGHFLSAMGAEVTIIGRNKQFLKEQEPEISKKALEDLQKHMYVLTDHEVIETSIRDGKKIVIARNRANQDLVEFETDLILVAAGRVSNAPLIKPANGGINVDEHDWIITDARMRTNMDGVWAFGDANGQYLFKHVANKESITAYYDMMKHEAEMEYDAIPWAVFTYPEIAGVGLGQCAAADKYGKENIAVGFQFYGDTAKGAAMNLKDYFVKVIIHRNGKLIGAHIIGPQASVLIQEIVTLMYTTDGTFLPITEGMHIHPALSEVVERAFGGWMAPERYNAMLREYKLL